MARVFGERSKRNLEGVHPLLVKVAEIALQKSETDFTVICGHRDKAGQDAAIAAGTSKVRYPNSAHNQMPSCAIDVIPYPFLGWDDKAGWRKIADAMLAAAKECGVSIRWGGGIPDAKFNWDMPHFELHPWRDYKK